MCLYRFVQKGRTGIILEKYKKISKLQPSISYEKLADGRLRMKLEQTHISTHIFSFIYSSLLSKARTVLAVSMKSSLSEAHLSYY